jgi:hypothetical protein
VYVKGCTGLAMKLEKKKHTFKQIQHLVYKTWFTEKARTRRQKMGSESLERQKIFLFPRVSRQAVGPIRPPIPRVPEGLSARQG